MDTADAGAAKPDHRRPMRGAALLVTAFVLVTGCGAVSGSAVGHAGRARTPVPSRPSARTLPTRPPGATPPAVTRTPDCAAGAATVAFTRTCQLTMRTGMSLTATLKWPFRVTRVTGDAVRVHDTVTVSGAQRFRLTATGRGVATIIAGTPQSPASGPPTGRILVFVEVVG